MLLREGNSMLGSKEQGLRFHESEPRNLMALSAKARVSHLKCYKIIIQILSCELQANN